MGMGEKEEGEDAAKPEDAGASKEQEAAGDPKEQEAEHAAAPANSQKQAPPPEPVDAAKVLVGPIAPAHNPLKPRKGILHTCTTCKVEKDEVSRDKDPTLLDAPPCRSPYLRP